MAQSRTKPDNTDPSRPAAVIPGTEGRPMRVAIVGSGPSGFYAADYLLKSDLDVQVHMFERLPAPFGLVRFGVAPDHAKIRSVVNVYRKAAADERAKVREIGR